MENFKINNQLLRFLKSVNEIVGNFEKVVDKDEGLVYNWKCEKKKLK